jgi:hypothetical protein
VRAFCFFFLLDVTNVCLLDLIYVHGHLSTTTYYAHLSLLSDFETVLSVELVVMYVVVACIMCTLAPVF